MHLCYTQTEAFESHSTTPLHSCDCHILKVLLSQAIHVTFPAFWCSPCQFLAKTIPAQHSVFKLRGIHNYVPSVQRGRRSEARRHSIGGKEACGRAVSPAGLHHDSYLRARYLQLWSSTSRTRCRSIRCFPSLSTLCPLPRCRFPLVEFPSRVALFWNTKASESLAIRTIGAEALLTSNLDFHPWSGRVPGSVESREMQPDHGSKSARCGVSHGWSASGGEYDNFKANTSRWMGSERGCYLDFVLRPTSWYNIGQRAAVSR